MKISGFTPDTSGQARYHTATCRSCSMMACVFICSTITLMGSTGSGAFGLYQARATRAPSTSASTAMTTYFMRRPPGFEESKRGVWQASVLQIAEIVLENRQGRDGGGFCAQDARAHADLPEAVVDRELLFLWRQPAFRSNEQQGPACEGELARIAIAV